MRQWNAFFKKELLEVCRSGKLLITYILFCLFGIMNPAVAKLTPWMMKIMSESLEETGLVVTEIQVDALSSWTQFYKNTPMVLLIFVILFSGILTNEYQKGTLINMLTKGLSRRKIITSKGVLLLLIWTTGYWTCYGITYTYNMYFWDNSIAEHLAEAAACVYFFGLFMILLILFFSAMFRNSSGVLLAAVSVLGVSYICGMFPALSEYVPTHLLSAGAMLTGSAENYWQAAVVTGVSGIVLLIGAVLLFNRKDVQ